MSNISNPDSLIELKATDNLVGNHTSYYILDNGEPQEYLNEIIVMGFPLEPRSLSNLL